MEETQELENVTETSAEETPPEEIAQEDIAREEVAPEQIAIEETPPVEAKIPQPPVEGERLASAIEAILFAADRPVTVERLREVFGEDGPSEDTLGEALVGIKGKFLTAGFGFELREAQGGYQFTTRIENADFVRRFLQTKPFKVGRSALETLAIIAYRQPVTRAEIDEVRGIDSSHLLRTLIERGLVKMAGKAEIPGRPVTYATTAKFLETIGLKSISELPPLTELEQLEGHTQDDQQERLEEGLNRFIKTAATERVKVEEENQAEFEVIHSLLETVQNADREIFESQAHQEVAQANQEALDAFQASAPKRRRKQAATTKEVKFEDLVASDVSVEPTEEPPTDSGEYNA